MSEQWLPNLVGGVSIWKLGVDLNEAKFFDGRLLVPETEGSESLPASVRWDLTGLVPLTEAQTSDPAGVAAATADFQAALGRVAKVFATPSSGYDKFKDAFTVPALTAEGAANYFYSREKKKLFVINWGASPRSMAGSSEYVFGYERWNKVLPVVVAAAGVASASAATAEAPPAITTSAGEPAKEDDKKKKEEPLPKSRPWWLWPLFALVAIALVLLALLLLRACETKNIPGTDAAADAAADAADGGLDAGDAADSEADAADAAHAGDAAVDAAGDTAAADAGLDAAREGGGGLALDDDEDDDGASASGGAGGGPVVVVKGPGGGAKTPVHRRHYQNEAVAWRVAGGNERVSRTEQRGHRYDVWLSPGKTFEGVRVEWQDKAGKWHAH